MYPNNYNYDPNQGNPMYGAPMYPNSNPQQGYPTFPPPSTSYPPYHNQPNMNPTYPQQYYQGSPFPPPNSQYPPVNSLPPPSNFGAPPYYPSAPPQMPQSNYPTQSAPSYPSPYPPTPYQGGFQQGRKKALLVGINYAGTAAELRGCINDVRNMKNFLLSFGYTDSPATMMVLTDDQSDSRRLPTRENMLNGMRWLVAGAQPGDSLFFHFSGHGGQARDTDGDEEDGWDETILPCDYKMSGQLIDDVSTSLNFWLTR